MHVGDPGHCRDGKEHDTEIIIHRFRVQLSNTKCCMLLLYYRWIPVCRVGYLHITYCSAAALYYYYFYIWTIIFGLI